jgi:FMN phosphatase YigB (HAD superfamily)
MPHSTDLVLRDLDVVSYLDPVVLSEETGVDKPSPAIFLKACREPNGSHTLKPEQCVHVGDELDW